MDATSRREAFLETGWVRVDQAAPGSLMDALRRRLTEDAGETAPGKLGDYGDSLFRSVFQAAGLRAALDDILGVARWDEPLALQDVRIKRPGPERQPWWHIDVFEQGPDTIEDDPLTWRASLAAGGVAVLATLLLSDVDDDAAPTAVRTGSHRLVRDRLAAAGPGGLSLGELLGEDIASATATAEVAPLTGPAGTAYLCHPLLVHTPLANRGEGPIFTALQPIGLKP